MTRSDEVTDDELLRAAVSRVGQAGQFPVAFGALASKGIATITTLVGNKRDSLMGLRVEMDRGLGGRAMSEGRPRLTSDYRASPHITHDYDEAVLGEGIRSLLAAPIVVGRVTRGVIYGGTHAEVEVGGVLAAPAIRIANDLAQEFAVRDEVERRLQSLKFMAVDDGSMSVTQLADLREALAELRGIASSVTTDVTLRQRIDAVQLRLSHLGRASPSSTPAVTLTPRELDVLGYVAIGASNAEIARSLSLAEATVKAYLGTAMSKLDAGTRFEAVQTARRAGLLT